VGERGVAPGRVVNIIKKLKIFLEKSDLSLGATSWDAVVLRILESQGIDIEQEPSLAERVLDLYSPYGKEMSTRNSPTHDQQWRPLSPFLIDGTAAILGVAHRILHSYIMAGNIAGALRSFHSLQIMTDKNKARSIEEFFQESKRSTKEEEATHINFESRYSNIEYPGLFPQIPVHMLAPFLDLVTEARAFTFGSWLVGSTDPDGPIIPRKLYTNAAMVPSLVRYASAAKDVSLLERVLTTFSSSRDDLRTTLSESTLLALLETQLNNKDWQSLERTFSSLARNPNIKSAKLSMAIALLVRTLLTLDGQNQRDRDNPVVKRDLDEATKVFGSIARGGLGFSRRLHRSSLDNVLATLACVNSDYAEFCWGLGPDLERVIYVLPKEAFNIMLEGVVSAYGSIAGKQLLCKFWKPAGDAEHRSQYNLDETELEDQGGVPRMPVERPDEFAHISPNQVAIKLSTGTMKPTTDNERILMIRGKFRPNISTIRIILRQLIKERPRPTGKSSVQFGSLDIRSDNRLDVPEDDKMVFWATRVMRLLDMREKDMLEELRQDFSWEKTQPRTEAEGHEQVSSEE